MSGNERNENFEARLDLVPQSPGVYLMKDASGSVIYVGKAVNLRRRLRSYFGPTPQGNEKVMAMISHIRDFSYLLCQNELESFILESNLIKRYQPFYNILLKDDHDYPYIRVTLQEMYPRIMKAYRVGPDEAEGAKYYGPYLNGDLWQALRTIHQLFPLKTCKRQFPRDIGKERPCLNYYIKKCIGPCLGTVKAEDYRQVIYQVCDFLEGRYDGIQKDLEEKMYQASEALDFEQAALYRDRLASLNKLQEKQVAVMDQDFDADALGLARNSAEVCVLKLEIRSGKITGTSTYFLDATAYSDEEVVRAFIEQYYPGAATIPRTIMTGVEALAEDSGLCAFLTGLSGRKVQIHYPQRGEKRHVLDMAETNATQALRRRTIIQGQSQQSVDEAMQLLAKITGLPYPPARIEAYDVSNTGKDDMTCAMVVFENGKVRRNQARTFNIRRQEGQDDYRAMTEAIDRRLNHIDDAAFGRKPDLILLDGGLGHVTVIKSLLEERGFADLALAGMVKDRRHRTRGLVLADGNVVELAESLGLLKENAPHPESRAEISWFSEDPGVEREQKLALLRLLTGIQNEAHRVAGQANRRLNKKRQTRFKLEDIPGVGPKKRQKLMQAFRSIKEISQADVEELLAKVPSLGQTTAENIYTHFHPQEEESP